MSWTEKLLSELSNIGLSSDASDKVLDLVKGWVGGDLSTIADCLINAVDDGKVDSKEIIQLLSAIADTYGKPSNPFIVDLLDHLKDGVLTTADLGDIAGVWAASRVSEPNLQTLVKVAFQGHLNVNEIKNAVIGYVRLHSDSNTADALESALDGSGELTLQTVVMAVVSFLVVRRNVIEVGSSLQDQTTAILKALNQLGQTKLLGILIALSEDNFSAALKLILESLNVFADETLVKQILAGRIGDALHSELLKFLKRSAKGITDDQANELADFLAGILTGTTQLIAENDDRAETGLGEEDYQFWLRVRRVIWAATRATQGGPTIPTASDGAPSFASIARIGFRIQIKQVIPAAKRDTFLQMLLIFARAEFSKNLPTFFRPEEFNDGRVFGSIYSGILTGLSNE